MMLQIEDKKHLVTAEAVFKALPNDCDGFFLVELEFFNAANYFLQESSIIDVWQGSKYACATVPYRLPTPKKSKIPSKKKMIEP